MNRNDFKTNDFDYELKTRSIVTSNTVVYTSRFVRIFFSKIKCRTVKTKLNSWLILVRNIELKVHQSIPLTPYNNLPKYIK